MAKKSIQTSKKPSKQEKKQQLNNLIKILRPKVYITDSSNFKNLVQQLTGNIIGTNSSPVIISSDPPTHEIPIIQNDHQVHVYDENYNLDLSFDSSCFSTPLEGSPDLQASNYVLENSLGVPKMDFSLQNWDFESLLMEMDSVYKYDCDPGNNYGMINNQQEVCVYDYDLSSFM